MPRDLGRRLRDGVELDDGPVAVRLVQAGRLACRPVAGRAGAPRGPQARRAPAAGRGRAPGAAAGPHRDRRGRAGQPAAGPAARRSTTPRSARSTERSACRGAGGSSIAVFAPRRPSAAMSEGRDTHDIPAILRLAMSHLDHEAHRSRFTRHPLAASPGGRADEELDVTGRLHGVVAMDGPSGHREVHRRPGGWPALPGPPTSTPAPCTGRSRWPCCGPGWTRDSDAEAVSARGRDGRRRSSSVTDPAAPAILLAGEDVAAEIRGPEVTGAVSAVSAQPAVRAALVARQRRLIAEALRAGRAGSSWRAATSAASSRRTRRSRCTSPRRSEIRAARRGAQDRKAGRDGDPAARAGRRPAPRPARLHAQDLPAARGRGRARRLDTDELSVDAVLDRAAAAGEGAGPGPVSEVAARPAGRSAAGRLAVAARRGPLDRHLVLPAVLPGAGAPPGADPGQRAGGRWSPTTARWSTGRCCSDCSGGRAVFLVKREMFVGAGRLGAAPDRADRRCAAASRTGRPLTAALAVLRGGGLVGVFPEGTRGTGEVAAAQHGAAWLARTHRRGGAAGGRAGAPGGPAGSRRGGSGRGSTCWSGSRCSARRRWPGRAGRGAPRPSGPRWPRWCENSTRYGAARREQQPTMAPGPPGLDRRRDPARRADDAERPLPGAGRRRAAERRASRRWSTGCSGAGRRSCRTSPASPGTGSPTTRCGTGAGSPWSTPAAGSPTPTGLQAAVAAQAELAMRTADAVLLVVDATRRRHHHRRGGGPGAAPLRPPGAARRDQGRRRAAGRRHRRAVAARAGRAAPGERPARARLGRPAGRDPRRAAGQPRATLRRRRRRPAPGGAGRQAERGQVQPAQPGVRRGARRWCTRSPAPPSTRSTRWSSWTARSGASSTPPGLRKRVRTASGMEYYASLRTQAAIEAAEVVDRADRRERADHRAGPAA